MMLMNEERNAEIKYESILPMNVKLLSNVYYFINFELHLKMLCRKYPAWKMLLREAGLSIGSECIQGLKKLNFYPGK